MSWQASLLLLAPAFPIALAVLMLVPHLRRPLSALLPAAPLPALAGALLLPAGLTQPLPDLLLGVTLAVSDPGRLFMGAAALLWCLSAVFARASIPQEGQTDFAGWWLATLSGNMLLFLTADVASFYLAFALLSLGAFGLVIHSRTEEAKLAGRVYLVLAVLGETCLLLGLLLCVQASGSMLIADMAEAVREAPRRDLTLGLLVTGFGIKAGLMPLHVWLPLAHPAAPLPASAVLSGAIVKAGIYGLLVFLPLGPGLPGWSGALILIGLCTAYLGILLGLPQERPKTVLAYSTLSQMGLLVAVIGIALDGDRPSIMTAAVAFYAMHHGLAKGALFLSVGVLARSGGRWRPMFALAALMALAVAGLPFTGGALAKLAIKGAVAEGLAATLIGLSAVGTTLLMLRFLHLARSALPEQNESPPIGLGAPFLLCVFAALAMPWLLFPDATGLMYAYAFEVTNLWNALWPLLLGVVAVFWYDRTGRRLDLRIPEGDILVPVARMIRNCMRLYEEVRAGRLSSSNQRIHQ